MNSVIPARVYVLGADGPRDDLLTVQWDGADPEVRLDVRGVEIAVDRQRLVDALATPERSI